MKYIGFMTAIGFVAFAAPVEARQCPRGQFYRVSQNACIPRTEAVKAGIVKKRAVKSMRTKSAQDKSGSAKSERAKSAELNSDKKKPAQAASPAKPATASPQRAIAANPFRAFAQQHALDRSVRRNIAPFGALQFTGLR
ncbi:MAG: hypothetical protein ACK5JM_04910 [Rhodoblastus sp.]